MKITEVTSKQIINCKTESEAERICKLMHDAGLKWNTCISYLEYNHWDVYKENTCYNPSKGAYLNIDYYKEEGYEILDSTLITSEPEFKWGQDVEVSDDGKLWYAEKFVGMNPSNEAFISVCSVGIVRNWVYCRPFNPRKAEIEKQMAELQAELDELNKRQ